MTSRPELKKAPTQGFKHEFTTENKGMIDECYDIEKKSLGEGSYGTVTKGVDKHTKAVRAIKIIDRTKIPNETRFTSEVKIQQSLDHPNIVKLYEFFKDARKYYLVMELCTGGELFDRIIAETEKHEDGTAFTEKDAAGYMSKILGGISYMHGKNLAHRDIKPENFLMQNETREAEIKIIDFGLAAEFTDDKKLKTKAGTPFYVSPQVLQGRYNHKCDIWSCGVICYILLCGYPPFYGDTDDQILKAVKRGRVDFPSPEWDAISQLAKDFINKMLTMDEDKRPDATALLEDSWLKESVVKESKMVKDLGCRLRNFTQNSKFKKMALTVIANNLKDEELEELRKTFSALDENNNGMLSAAEIKAGMEKHKAQIPGDLDDIIAALDTDKSGNIDYTEFMAATLNQAQYQKKDILWAAFRKFDLNGDGKISKAELATLIKEDKDKIDKAIFQGADLDGDGEVDFEEFCAMMGLQASAK